MAESLSLLIKRLEAATARIEEIANANPTAAAGAGKPAAAGARNAADAHTINNPFTEGFEELLQSHLKDFIEKSEKIGGLVRDQANAVNQAFHAQLLFIQTAAQAASPNQTVLSEMIRPTQAALEKVTELREKNRTSPFFNHLSTVSEGIPALGWVAVSPKPFPFVGEMRDSAQFYANRVIKEFKDKDTVHTAWATSFIALLTELQGYVKKFHTTGLVWKANGADAKTVFASLSSSGGAPAPAAAPSAGGAPPPPGPPPAPIDISALQTSAQPDMNVIFNQLNRGESVTSGLKKVDKSQMTHKNPELRATSVVKADAVKSAPAPKAAAAAPKKPARTALDGNKWVVENHEGQQIVLDQTELKQTVYIYNCTNCTVTVKGKVNAITFDLCRKSGLVIDHAVSTVDIVNSKSVQLQVVGKVPTINIDKTDGCLVYLSKECLGVEILTAKSSELNVSLPSTEAGASASDFIERPLPEQYKSTISGNKIVTVAVEHAGG